MPRIPLFLLPASLNERAGRRLIGLGYRITKWYPGLEYDLREIGGPEAPEYAGSALLNALAWALLLFVLSVGLLFLRGSLTLGLIDATLADPAALPVLFSRVYPALVGFVVTLLTFTALFLYYPKILARKLAEAVDKDLVFAMKDLQLQLASGVTLFNALVNVANAGYGNVSKQFDLLVKDVNAGEAVDKGLEKMAARTESEFMRRAVWQMVTALRGGSSLEGALRAIIEVLRRDQAAGIKRYVGELNLWALVYLIFAVAIPGLGSTVLIVVSAFGGIRVNEFTYVMVLALSFVMQILIIGFVKSRRPVVHL